MRGGMREEECRRWGQSHDAGNLHARGGPCKPSFGATANDGAIKPGGKEQNAESEHKTVLFARTLFFSPTPDSHNYLSGESGGWEEVRETWWVSSRER